MKMSENSLNQDGNATATQHTVGLSQSQRDLIRRNRERARAIRQARLETKPYDVAQRPLHEGTKDVSVIPAESSRGNSGVNSLVSGQSRVGSSSVTCRDTGGGYLLEENEEEGAGWEKGHRLLEEKAPALPDEQMTCEECGKKFAESYLFSQFNFSVCDKCRDPKGKHSFITKTEAKQKYLLKDCDFGERDGPALPFILKRNPHSSRWGDMHLYLTAQVEARSYQVWGGPEGLEAEHERKREMREKKREKKYAKEIKQLRKAVRSSISQSVPKTHEHTFTQETYSAETDMWTKTCSVCGHQISYEKM